VSSAARIKSTSRGSGKIGQEHGPAPQIGAPLLLQIVPGNQSGCLDGVTGLGSALHGLQDIEDTVYTIHPG
jgi:hypothetical protein